MTTDCATVGNAKQYGEATAVYLRGVYSAATAPAAEGEIITLLREQLAAKDAQITALHQLLAQQQQVLLLGRGVPWKGEPRNPL